MLFMYFPKFAPWQSCTSNEPKIFVQWCLLLVMKEVSCEDILPLLARSHMCSC